MRLALIVYGSLSTLSGGYLYDRQLVAALERGGHEVTVISQRWGVYARRVTQNWRRETMRALIKGQYDLVLQDELNHPSLWLLNRRLRRQVRSSLVAIVHHLRSSERHPRPARALYRAVEAAYVRSVHGFIFNSATTRTAVGDLLGRPLPPHVVARPAPNPDLPHLPSQPGDGRLRILFVANVAPRKGLHDLLEAVAALPAGTWTLDIVGSLAAHPAYAARLRRAAPPGDAVRWHGRLDEEALAQRYAAADVLCVPSQYEGYGIVYAEALAHGVIPVASTAGAAAEVVKDGVNGLLVPPGEPAALARCLAALQVDGARRRMLSAAARNTALPTWAESMGRAVTFLEGLIAREVQT